MTPEEDAQLRAPFPPESIGKKPVIWCRACSADKQRHHCDQHKPKQCKECGNKRVTPAHDHLDFVGHAFVRERLLEVDRHWNWKPLAFTDRGLPLFDEFGGMWMFLTVCGETRLGYGDAAGKKGPNAVKEVIGDGLRNAGQSFGIALDQWKKSSAQEVSADPVDAVQSHTEQAVLTKEQLLGQLRGKCTKIYQLRGKTPADLAADYTDWSTGPDAEQGREITTETDQRVLSAFVRFLENQGGKS